MGRDVGALRGWDVVRLTAGQLEADVVPGKGGDVLAVRHRGRDLLWQAPWGLRARGALATKGSSAAGLIEAYPGGWQTVFPNGGGACEQHGVEWGMHGEAWLAPWDVVAADDTAVTLSTRLVRSPFRLTKTIRLEPEGVRVEESARNEGGVAVEVMWSHHPAFGAPLLGAGAVLDTNAAEFIADDGAGAPTREPAPASRGPWPVVAGVDLRRLPGPDETRERFGYLTGFPEQAHVEVRNAGIGLAVRLRWSARELPYAWYWLEAHATPGFPWYQGVYVLGIEPATSWPGQGLVAVREKTGTQVSIGPGEERSIRIALDVVEL